MKQERRKMSLEYLAVPERKEMSQNNEACQMHMGASLKRLTPAISETTGTKVSELQYID